ncbi:rCG47546, partial [Rattus norvegicus]
MNHHVGDENQTQFLINSK